MAPMFALIILSSAIVINAEMIIQSCVKDISINDVTAASYGSTINITLTVDNDNSNQKYTQSVPFVNGNANISAEICFDFDTSATTNIISYNPKRARSIQFDILDNFAVFGGANALFPNPINGSIKSSFKRESVSIFDGTMTFSLYHQIKANNLFLKIANRNFNVFRQCFDLRRLCIYEGGIENAQYPNDCSTNIQTTHITLNPDDGTTPTPKANILSNNNAVWSSTPTPTPTIPTGTDTKKCWSPYSQYIIINLSPITSFSAISLGFEMEPSDKDSGDASGAPPRWLTFAFDTELSHLQSSETEVDQYWAVDLKDGNFDSEDVNVWTINPLFFQLDTKPAPNRFRMTQLTKGFGLQYIANANIEYQSVSKTIWNTYSAAYIKNGVVNTVSASDPDFQVQQLAQIACQDIFPNMSSTVKISYQSNKYSACWNYAMNRDYKCYDYTSSALAFFTSSSFPVFYPPVSYFIKSVATTPQDLPYCVFGSTADLSSYNDWSSCDISDSAPLRIQECVNSATDCDNGKSEFRAIPMGWECTVPVTDEPTTEPTVNPTTAAPTTSSPTSNPTMDPTTANPTTYPTNDPTFDPTADPTVDPTRFPTMDPTFDPTMDPTLDPTDNPSTEPTNVPSTNPTIEPTQNPTISPSESTLAPSQNPTVRPTDNPIISNENGVTDSPTESGSAGGKEGGDEDANTLPWWIWLVVICGAVLICCCFIIFFVGRSKKDESKQKVAVDDNEDKSLADIAAVTDADNPTTTNGNTTQGNTNTSIELAEANKANQSSSSDSDDDEQDIYAKGGKRTKNVEDMYGNMPRQMTNNGGNNNRLSVAVEPNLQYQPSDDLVLNEGNITMGMPDSNSPNSPSSMEGGGQRDGDPAVTGANIGDPQITKGNDNETKSGIIMANVGSSSSSEDESDKVYDKESESDDDDDDVMYDKKNKYQSKGGPNKKEKKKKEVVYGDPVVTSSGGNDDQVDDDEFDDEENYQI